jgi:hypothetical protein
MDAGVGDDGVEALGDGTTDEAVHGGGGGGGAAAAGAGDGDGVLEVRVTDGVWRRFAAAASCRVCARAAHVHVVIVMCGRASLCMSCRRAESGAVVNTVTVRIVWDLERKPYLGGFRNKRTDAMYHNATYVLVACVVAGAAWLPCVVRC